MPSTFSPSLRIELIADGEQAGVWGATTNNNLGDLLEQAITGNTAVDITAGNITLTSLNGIVDQARSAVLVISGSSVTTRIITIPNVSKTYTVRNSSNITVQIKTASGTAYNCPTLSESYIYCNGLNVITGRSITDEANLLVTSNPTPFTNPDFLGIPTAPTAAVGTNTQQIATTAFVRSIIPTGVILLWSGSTGSIPAGWALCNGTGGTPDLRDRFVIGAGGAYGVGSTGGATNVTLTIGNLPSHTHTGTTNNTSIAHTHTFSDTTSSAGTHTHSVTDPGHVHSYTRGVISGSLATGGANNVLTTTSDLTSLQFTGISIVSAGAHTHTVSGTTSSSGPTHNHSFTTGGTGSDDAFSILPPYYALAYIMKT
jgi:microcystin-dependent protein